MLCTVRKHRSGREGERRRGRERDTERHDAAPTWQACYIEERCNEEAEETIELTGQSLPLEDTPNSRGEIAG
jgi:hypothetical protein